MAGARTAIQHIDMRVHEGAHPCVGALDVVPIVYLTSGDRELAHDEAVAVGNRLAGELDLPVFMYGELASAEERRERAFFREGGASNASARVTAGELVPDFGPGPPASDRGGDARDGPPAAGRLQRRAGHLGRRAGQGCRAKVREAGGGLPGVRAIGVMLASRGVAQVLTNVHDPLRVPLREVVEAVRREAEPLGARVAGAEIVGFCRRRHWTSSRGCSPERLRLGQACAGAARARVGSGQLGAPAAAQAQASRDPGRHRPRSARGRGRGQRRVGARRSDASSGSASRPHGAGP